ncbi:MAG: GNAT family N-acetyltransferase [Bacteroidales bacterium]|nr:GNAT family N-acetyltransferase [Bacteroidales bacterium]
MIKTKIFDAGSKPDKTEKREIVDFLFTHLEQYGDLKRDIERAVDYAIQEIPSYGGFLLISYEESGISGAVVMNKTGMKGYIPENILVYIATHKDLRGQGIGKYLMKKSIGLADGNVALHVEHDNPARYLYEKIGFTNKYLEMRYAKQSN